MSKQISLPKISSILQKIKSAQKTSFSFFQSNAMFFSCRELPDYSAEMMIEFLASVSECEKSKDKRACRGPFLAHLELDKICREECIYSDTRQSKLSDVVFFCYQPLSLILIMLVNLVVLYLYVVACIFLFKIR